MDSKLNEAKAILKKYNQEHLLHFYKSLSLEQRTFLLNQILRIDFEKVLSLYESSKINIEFSNENITPLEHFEKNKFSDSEISYYSHIGEKLLKENSFAIVTMAGGQGSRLGYSGPKGTYELFFEETNERKSLFEIICEDILRINNKYKITIPWYIMTSKSNDVQTRAYFEAHNYFNYPKESVKFFIQDRLPVINLDKKFILEEPFMIKEASNGNGNVFKSMQKNGIIDDLKKKHIKWISFCGIDNILLKTVDPFFLGLTIDKNYEIASKSVFKTDPLDKISVFCKSNGKPSILLHNYINLEMSNSKFDNGMYKYRESNMLYHLMSLEAVEKACNIDLKYHKALKKNSFINEEGVKQVPDQPNIYKFEHFIFDIFYYFDDMLLLRVNEEEEFAPIKDFTSKYNPDTAMEKYLNYWKKDRP